jgi:hypothetical protein
MTGPPKKNSPFLSDTPQMNADQAARSLGSVHLTQITITSHSTLDELPLATRDRIQFQAVNFNRLQSLDRLDTQQQR